MFPKTRSDDAGQQHEARAPDREEGPKENTGPGRGNPNLGNCHCPARGQARCVTRRPAFAPFHLSLSIGVPRRNRTAPRRTTEPAVRRHNERHSTCAARSPSEQTGAGARRQRCPGS